MGDVGGFMAAILVGSREPLVVDEVKINNPLDVGQVLVRLNFSGICGAQLNEIDAVKGVDAFLPHLLGHEGYGEVLEIGPGVRSVREGSMVVLHWLKGDGIESVAPKYRWGRRNLNAGWVTTFNELAIVSENRITEIQSTLTPQLLPLFGCAATTANGVVGREARVQIGESVVVFGAGGVGLATIAALKAAGAWPIVAIDLSHERLRAAAGAGASHVFNANMELSIATEIRLLLGGGADVVIETTGKREIIQLSYELAQPSGRVTLVGVPNVNDPISIGTLPLHLGVSLQGTKGGSAIPSKDIPRLIRACENGVLPLQSIPTQVFRLEQINTAIESLRGTEPGRMILDLCG